MSQANVCVDEISLALPCLCWKDAGFTTNRHEFIYVRKKGGWLQGCRAAGQRWDVSPFKRGPSVGQDRAFEGRMGGLVRAPDPTPVAAFALYVQKMRYADLRDLRQRTAVQLLRQLELF